MFAMGLITHGICLGSMALIDVVTVDTLSPDK